MYKNWLGLLGIFLLSTAATYGALPSRFHEFSQVGDGEGISTIVLLMNKGDSAVTATIDFIGQDGTPMTVTVDGATDSSFGVPLQPGATARIQTSGESDPVKVGWARIVAGSEIGAQVVFEIRSEGDIATQAAVESLGGLSAADVFVEQSDENRTGLALANLSSVGPVNVQLSLFDDVTGALVDEETITLGAFSQNAQFLDEIFDGLGDMRGSLRLSASGPVAVTVLQQAGLVLGTLTPQEIF